MPLHRIHLRGPWEVRWLDPPLEQVDCSERRVTMPDDWFSIFGKIFGRARFTRRFQWPTKLEEGETVSVVFDGIGGHASVRLNGEELGSTPESATTAAFDITVRLRSTNLLEVEIEFDPLKGTTGGLYGPVALEIAG